MLKCTGCRLCAVMCLEAYRGRTNRGGRGNKMEKKFMKGNVVRRKCRFGRAAGFAGYPITPQSEIPEYLSRDSEVGGLYRAKVK